MTTIVEYITNKAAGLLNDPYYEHWNSAELVDYVNQGQREAVKLNPSLYVVTSIVDLIAGYKQSLPADGMQLVAVNCNYNADGVTPGRAITFINQDDLDLFVPTWRSSTPQNDVEHFMYNPDVPKVWYNWPPQPVTPNKVEISYSAAPPLSDLSEIISIDDVYVPALIDYVLFRAYSKDAEYAGEDGLAAGHYNAFKQMVVG